MPPVSNFLVRAFFLSSLVVSFAAKAQTLTPAESDFFENKIRPIFVNDCYKCHSQSAPKLKGGLSLETRQSVLAGGDTGPAIEPGNPDKSLLIQAVRYLDEDLQMPPKGEKLSDEKIADLVTWVTMGAPDPRVASAGSTNSAAKASARDHWSFQPIKNSPVPETVSYTHLTLPTIYSV